MKRLIILFSIMLTGIVSYSQKYQDALLHGENKNRLDVLSLLGIPNDTLAPPAYPQDKRRKPHIAVKGNSLYIWDTVAYKWNIYAPGGSGGSADSTLFATLYRLDSAKNNLRNSIGTKLNIADTANKWITSVYRKPGTDSVFYGKGGSQTFAFKDSTGGAGTSSDSSMFLIDTTYTRLAKVFGTDTLLLKSFLYQFNGVDATVTETDSTAVVNYVVPLISPTDTADMLSWYTRTIRFLDSVQSLKNRYNRSFDTILYVNDTTVIWQRFDGTADTLQFHPMGTSYSFTAPLSEIGGAVSLDTTSGKWRSEGYNDTKYYPLSNPEGYVSTRDRFGLTGEDVRRTADGVISFSSHSFRLDSVIRFSIVNPLDSLVFKDGELRLNLSDAGNYGLQTKSLWWNDDGNGYTGYLGVGGVNGWTMNFMGSSVGLFGPDSVRFEGYMKLKDKASAPTSSAGYGFIYPKTDGKLYFTNHSGTEYDLTSGGGGGLTKGTTTIASSATRRILYDSSGVLSNNANFIYNSSGELIVGGTTDNGAYVLQVNGGNVYYSGNIYTGGTIIEMGNGARVNFGGAGSNPSILANSTSLFAAKRDNSDYVDFTSKNLIATGTITTGNPGSGAGAWLLGKRITSTVTLDTTKYIEVKVDGVTCYIALVTPS